MNNKGNKTFITLSLVPATILFFIFIIIPTMNVFWMSLFKWGGLINNKKFVGLDNFIMLFKDSNFLKSFQNTIFLLVIVTIITMALAIISAAILVKEDTKFKNFFRIIFYFPNILSVVVISAIFSAILDPNQGIVNSTLNFFNLNSLTRMWLGDQKVVIWCIAFAMIWQAIGYYMVMYMSSISGISISLYESASLDGATGIQQFFKITLPLVWNTIRTTLTFFCNKYNKFKFLICKSNDIWWTRWIFRSISELYVQAGL